MKKCYNSFIRQFNDLKSTGHVWSQRGNKCLSSTGNLVWFLSKKWIKILIVPSFRLKFDDVTVTLCLIVLSWNFFANSPWYYLTSYQNLLRLNVIFMVRKIDQPLLNGGGGGRGWLPPPSTLPLSNFRAKAVGPIWKIFHGQMSQGWAYS